MFSFTGIFPDAAVPRTENEDTYSLLHIVGVQGGVVFVVFVAIFDLSIWGGILTSPASHLSENRLHIGLKFGYDIFFVGVLIFYLLNFLSKGHERKDYVCAIHNATTCENSCYVCEGSPSTCNPNLCDTPNIPNHCEWLTGR